MSKSLSLGSYGNNVKQMNTSIDVLPKIKNNIQIDKDTIIEENEVVFVYNLTVKSGVTLTVRGTLIDLAKKRSIK